MSEETKFLIGEKAEILYTEVFDLTTNRQHYPVKFRRLADKLQEYALDIHSDIMDANSYPTDTSNHKQKRYDLQTSAITKCNKLASLVKYSLHAHLISFSTSEKLIALIHDVKFMAFAWRKQS